MADSLDELEELASTYYAAVPNLNIPPPVYQVPVLSAGELQVSIFHAQPNKNGLAEQLYTFRLQKEISFRTVKDLPYLLIQFPIPDQSHNWDSQVACLFFYPIQN